MRALVLSGGGVKGAFQLGVLRELLNNNPELDYDVYTGISVGALNASLLASDKLSTTLPELENTWFEKVKGNHSIWKHHLWKYILSAICIILFFVILAFLTFIFSAPKLLTIILGCLALGSFYIPYYALMNTHSIYNNDPLRKLVSENLDIDGLRNNGRKLRIGAVSFETGEYRVADEMNPKLLNWIMASSSFPVFFPMEEIEGQHWTDGGVSNIAPLQDALDLGVTEIDIILASPIDVGEAGELLGIPGEMMRIIDIMSSEILRNDIRLKCSLAGIDLKIRVFVPEAQLTSNSLNFDLEGIQRMYQEGRKIAKMVLKS